MECPTCRAAVAEDAAFCSSCGSRLAQTAIPAAPAPPGYPWQQPAASAPYPPAPGSPYPPPGAPQAPPGGLYAPPPPHPGGIYAPPPPAGGFYAPQLIAGPTRLEPTSWTEPLQLATVAWLAVSALTGIFLTLANSAEIADQIRQQIAANPGITSPQAADVATSVATAVTFGLPVGFGIAMLLLAALCYLTRATWTFVVSMVLAALGALGGLFNLAALAGNPNTAANAGNRLAINGFIGLLGIGLVIFMAASLSRFGVWACRRVPA